MSLENAKTLFNKLKEDKALLEQLKTDPDTVLKAYGCTKEEIKELEMTARKNEVADKEKELDMDELATVSGGRLFFPTALGPGNCTGVYYKERCAATVEEGSWCYSNDYCDILSATYTYTREAAEKHTPKEHNPKR